MMKAVAVYPGKPCSMHLEDVLIPKVTDIPNTALKEGIFTHPTLAEGLNNLFMTLDS